MKHEIQLLKTNDWSINLEDEYYVEHPEELLPEAIEAVKRTAPGCYVNVVTPGGFGSPEDGFIDELNRKLQEEQIPIREVRFIDECGCGGFVTRVYR